MPEIFTPGISKHYEGYVTIDAKDVNEVRIDNVSDHYMTYGWLPTQRRITLDVKKYKLQYRPSARLQAVMDLGHDASDAIEILDALDAVETETQ